MQEKKVRISVEDSKLHDLGRTAKSLANDMITSSRKYTTSSKEVLRDLEDQIKLIEKRNRLDQQQQQSGLQSRFAAGNINKPQFQKEISGIRAAGQEDKLQLSLLREIIESIKATSKNEIREDRIGVEKKIRGDKSINKLGVTGSPEEALKRTIQQGLLGDIGEEETGQRSKFQNFGKFGKGAGKAFNTVAGLGTSKNEFYAAAGILGLVPLIGEGLSNIATKLFSSAEGIGVEKENFARSRRMSVGGVNAMGLPSTARDIGARYGLNAQEVMQRETSYYNVAKSKKYGIDINKLLSAESNLGLSQGDISGLYESSRHRFVGDSKGNAAGIPQVIAILNKFIRTSGQTQSVLPEILNSYKTIASQISQSGFVNPIDLSGTISGIARSSGLEGQHLDRFLGGVQGLAGGTNNPIMKAQMMRAFRQTNPNASLWDIQKGMESPFEHTEAMSKLFSNLKNQTGGGDQYKQVLYSAFAGKLNRRDIDLALSKNGDIGDILSSYDIYEDGAKKELGGGSDKVSEMTEASKKMDAVFQEFGDKTVQWSKDMMDSMKGKLDDMINGEQGEVAKAAKAEEEEENRRKMREAVAQGVADGFAQRWE